MDSHARTIVKSVSYRIVGLCATVLIALLLTRSGKIAASLGLIDTTVKIFLFYLHERAWLKIKFGQRKIPDYDI